MIRVGITGGIGSGKSTIARVFEVLGAPLFQADQEGKRLLNEDPELIESVQNRFGKHLYGPHGLDRKALAKLVFNDREALKELNALVHPRVRESFHNWCTVQEEKGAAYVVEEAAILVESGGYKEMDELLLVTAPEEMRIERVVKRDGSDPEEVRGRMREQMSDEAKKQYADEVLPNDDSQLLLPRLLELDERYRKEGKPNSS